MKRKTLFCFCLFLYLYSNLVAVKSISDIKNGNKVFDYNRYQGSVIEYENRLIVQGFFQIEEFEILTNGELNRVAFFETKFSLHSVKDEDKYYSVRLNSSSNLWNITVFDLSKFPMEIITDFDIIVYPLNVIPTILFTNEHILISDYDYRRIVLYCKKQYEVKGFITEVDSDISAKQDSLFVNLTLDTDRNLLIQLFSMTASEDNYVLELVSSVKVPTSFLNVRSIEISDDKLLICAGRGFLLVDISDIYTPEILYQINSEIGILKAIYTGDHVFFDNVFGDLFVYELLEMGESKLTFFEPGTVFNGFNMMFYREPYLYKNRGLNLTVYDTSNNFEEVFLHGNVDFRASFSVTEDDVYLIYRRRSNKYEVYSILNNYLICELNFEDDISSLYLTISENLLYVSYMSEGGHYLDIYEVYNQQVRLLKNHYISNNPSTFFIMNDDLIYFSQNFFSNSQISAFQYDKDNIKFIGTFFGRLQYILSNISKNHLITTQNNRIVIRDIYDHNVILLDYPVYGLESLWQAGMIEDGYLAVWNMGPRGFHLYDYHIENNVFNNFHNFSEERYNSFNGIFTKNAYTEHTSYFYNIQNGKVVELGNKHDFGEIRFTFLYPKKNKLVQIAGSGVWVYDFEYESVAENDETAKYFSTNLLGNYPNPFNPATTIKFRIENSKFETEPSHSSGLPTYISFSNGEGRDKGKNIRIDIYNIKGQKVRSLVNGFFTAGEHSVVWNGEDDYGVGVSSGIYLYRLHTPSYTETKKMVLIK